MVRMVLMFLSGIPWNQIIKPGAILTSEISTIILTGFILALN